MNLAVILTGSGQWGHRLEWGQPISAEPCFATAHQGWTISANMKGSVSRVEGQWGTLGEQGSTLGGTVRHTKRTRKHTGRDSEAHRENKEDTLGGTVRHTERTRQHTGIRFWILQQVTDFTTPSFLFSYPCISIQLYSVLYQQPLYLWRQLNPSFEL